MMTKNGMKIAINVVKEAMLYAVKLAAMQLITLAQV